MTDQSDWLNSAARAILARRAHLRAEWYARACEITATEAKTKASLLDLNLVIAILADQYVDDPVPNDPGAAAFQPIHAIEWYAKFLAALVNTCALVQRALNAGELTPRTETRIPIWTAELDAWTKRDIGGAVDAVNRVFWEHPPPLGRDSPRWPDHAAWAPPGHFVDQRQHAEWTARQGLVPPLPIDSATEDVPPPPPDIGLSKRERQIRAIEASADALGFERMSIPDGGKQQIKARCKSGYAKTKLFGNGDDPFRDAWQEAVDRRRIRMANHDRYSGSGD